MTTNQLDEMHLPRFSNVIRASFSSPLNFLFISTPDALDASRVSHPQLRRGKILNVAKVQFNGIQLKLNHAVDQAASRQFAIHIGKWFR